MSDFSYFGTSYKSITDCDFASAPFGCKNISVNIKAIAILAIAYFIVTVGILIDILINIPVKINVFGI